MEYSLDSNKLVFDWCDRKITYSKKSGESSGIIFCGTANRKIDLFRWCVIIAIAQNISIKREGYNYWDGHKYIDANTGEGTRTYRSNGIELYATDPAHYAGASLNQFGSNMAAGTTWGRPPKTHNRPSLVGDRPRGSPRCRSGRS